MKHSVNHRPWVNFKELRARLQFEDVLRHYKVEVRRKGEQHQGPCPLPGHTASKSAPTFSANLTRGIFQCFGCKARGNVLEFAALMERVDLENGDALRKVAVGLQERFFPEGASTRKSAAPQSAELKPNGAKPVIVNQPLDFALKDLDAGHSWFSEYGLLPETVAHFGLGYCARGYFAERIAIPLHNDTGQLIGYAGRTMDETWITGTNPLYLFPEKREREGKVLDFQKSLFLYNRHRIKTACDNLYIVSQFHSAWWLYQCGYQSVVAVMGAEFSSEQARLMVSQLSPSGRLWLMLDGDKEGEGLAQALLREVATHRFVRWVRLGDGKQPSDLDSEKLKQILLV